MANFPGYCVIHDAEKFIADVQKEAELMAEFTVRGKEGVFGALRIYVAKNREWMLGAVFPTIRELQDQIPFCCISTQTSERVTIACSSKMVKGRLNIDSFSSLFQQYNEKISETDRRTKHKIELVKLADYSIYAKLVNGVIEKTDSFFEEVKLLYRVQKSS